jgi:hypothetical protein
MQPRCDYSDMHPFVILINVACCSYDLHSNLFRVNILDGLKVEMIELIL